MRFSLGQTKLSIVLWVLVQQGSTVYSFAGRKSLTVSKVHFIDTLLVLLHLSLLFPEHFLFHHTRWPRPWPQAKELLLLTSKESQKNGA